VGSEDDPTRPSGRAGAKQNTICHRPSLLPRWENCRHICDSGTDRVETVAYKSGSDLSSTHLSTTRETCLVIRKRRASRTRGQVWNEPEARRRHINCKQQPRILIEHRVFMKSITSSDNFHLRNNRKHSSLSLLGCDAM